jgi:hypothetical protein
MKTFHWLRGIRLEPILGILILGILILGKPILGKPTLGKPILGIVQKTWRHPPSYLLVMHFGLGTSFYDKERHLLLLHINHPHLVAIGLNQRCSLNP